MEDWEEILDEGPVDKYESQAYIVLKLFFEENREHVFYGRQLEVIHEDKFFHWVTSRVLRELVAAKVLIREKRPLKWGGSIILYWHRSFRYPKRSAAKLIELVEEFSDDQVTRELGHYCELLVNESFSRFGFNHRGRNINEFRELKWTHSNHNLDFIWERDNICYGVEVKNTLGYIEKEEFYLKIDLCSHLKIVPMFVARMLPKNWIYDLQRKGGFALILKYQIYPSYLNHIAKSIRENLGLPVDSPRTLMDGTMQRLMKWHTKYVKFKGDSR
jgi:hypothetical protein